MLQPLNQFKSVRLDSLYLHIPFCFHKCHYCDFYSIVAPSGKASSQQADFVNRLIRELEVWASRLTCPPRTVFVGGGTPTLLRVPLWRKLLTALQKQGWLQAVEEFTVEANPETLGPDLIRTLTQEGVNRMSIGAQSFDLTMLKALERWHDPSNVFKSMTYARDAGLKNLNLDLIFAIPGQTLPMLHADLDQVLSLKPEHVSCYNLTFEPHTPLAQRLKTGQVQELPPQVQRVMYETVIARLRDAGYEHYEISNWARPGKRCQHNLVYWTSGNWLGLGPGAASHLDGYRWKNQPHLGKYLAEVGAESGPQTTPNALLPPIIDMEHLPMPQQTGERLMMHLRLLAGIEKETLTQSLDAADPRWNNIERLIDMGMLQRTATHVKLTGQGLFVADSVLEELL